MQNSTPRKGGFEPHRFVLKKDDPWSGARAAESGSLLRSCAPKGYRGFESPLLRNGM